MKNIFLSNVIVCERLKIKQFLLNISKRGLKGRLGIGVVTIKLINCCMLHVCYPLLTMALRELLPTVDLIFDAYRVKLKPKRFMCNFSTLF